MAEVLRDRHFRSVEFEGRVERPDGSHIWAVGCTFPPGP